MLFAGREVFLNSGLSCLLVHETREDSLINCLDSTRSRSLQATMTVRTATKELLCFIRDITPSPFLHHTTPSAIRSTAEQAAGVGEATGMTATLPQLSNPRARAGRDHHQGPIPGPPVLAVDQSFVAVKHYGNHSYLSDFRDFARRRTQSNDILDNVGRVRMQPETLCQPRPDYGICAAAFAELDRSC